mmetsp:Transcript_20231/g.43735  ORF Transcript_20231/g.43735 Transcript_20231/m.43735 type:complete len:306 (+) Transcript_20231:327-1244(+)|eukprot:CAMPEP_0168734584 /NCGR_PEP_ID=MMETSP0724-20121128/8889_1 /TAXON_ID=265536 /ORGANISM="Amphiprora sp., Strain CCMP467" /LENGTH=305 /DNA_ID=CAMNT_0008781693 /DNA_START=654 /DNA_END=1571 /DNA_ORIENTATION=-
MTDPNHNNNTNTIHHHQHNDPYHVFRHDMLRQLERVDEQLEILKRTASSSEPRHWKEAKKELKKSLKTAESTLSDLTTCVKLMQQQQQQQSSSSHVSEQEIYNRTSLVQSCRNRLSLAKQGMSQVVPSSSSSSSRRVMPDNNGTSGSRTGHNDASVGLLSNNDNNNNHHPSSSSRSGGGGGGYDHLHDDEESGKPQRQPQNKHNSSASSSSQARVLLQHQDETLDGLSAAVERVGYMADTIHDEIHDQNKLLTELDDDLQEAEEQLGLVMGKLSTFLGTKDRAQICTILILFAVAVLLFLLIVYT